MKFKIVRNWTSIKEKALFEVILKNKDTENWYNEVWRRFWKLSTFASEEEKQEYINKTPIFDVDESYECGIMSISHLQEFIKYL